MMNRNHLVIVVLLMSATVLHAVPADIPSTKARMDTIDLANRLLTPRSTTVSADEIASKNPLVPKRDIESSASTAPAIAATTSDRDILNQIANGISPSGTITFGDKTLLLLGQKKLKVGDAISIVFQGTSYQVQLVGVERTSYTLRLNKEEVTRPIKSSK